VVRFERVDVTGLDKWPKWRGIIRKERWDIWAKAKSAALHSAG